MSDVEFEGKILDINIHEVIDRLTHAGALFVKKQNFRRYVFGTIPEKKGKWMRLRSDGAETTITVKEIIHDGLDGTYEFETNVGDFDTMYTILKKAGFNNNGYQENRRTLYKIGDVEITIDEWPLIPAYIEIEGPNKKTVEQTAIKLGYTMKDLTGENTDKVYARYGIDLTQIKDLRF